MRKVKEIKSIPDKNGCVICISHHLNKAGYPVLRRDGKHWLMSRWLYTKEFGTIPKGLQIRHKCDNPGCINLEHLELGTHQDNADDMVKRNRSLYGETQRSCKLTEQQALEIIHDRKKSHHEMAEEYGIDRTTVSHIQRGKTWNYLFKKHKIIPKGKGRKGEFNGRAKLTEVEVKEIIKLYKTGKYTCGQLANKYNVVSSTIFDIVNRETWKHLK